MDINTNRTFENVTQGATANTPKKKFGKSSVFLVGGIFGALLVVGILYFNVPQMLRSKSPLSDQTEQMDSKVVEALVKDLGRIMILPTDETPTIFEITDPKAMIAEQPFFTGAIKGDKLLIYSSIARAIIYSPSRNLIVNVGPVTKEQSATKQGSAIEETSVDTTSASATKHR
ncbi:MAG: hypothetical protein CO060_00885 [Candidatus Yonathbacteria bacterium CG_4_9_14_0_2_um_filter_43_16]|uniref:Uncharacterized protein n=1 Tax=Candidatus Yonathbacteria bacterium CG_4_10_14_0_8_um_filter_43_17 TaxID=1975099 RepID=A0A2M7Q6M6_9BACT|nr:MAG: hypothetical protein COW60_03440 [Candidatus Yonathbacteria bacterium CG17_big_fil_post_rev_8_21_14_2_50_43_9]PIX56965.1 MAG: hypothetical protein COZ48_03240 [Candidatus Yonathbacteria bacterium CG_4_10_14_3_um_filter_43_12]PIY58725.1 MAG: hypothetical protein COY98_00555 [Candidatus Yonathbacteria bacterium CG_4_10_14_0_8_um_filter_43_17]PJC22405.1 MAG: hypothetical protein CO060_00885 [Candidatus Yonathbacteria bacterium CG_4_9_14_0_2_um_filter_43_16]